MHNRALHDTLAGFVEEAAWQLAEEVSGGAEVPFEVIEQGRSSAPLYCYRPLTDRFIAERVGVLARLPSYPAATAGLAAVPGLAAYLRARGRAATVREGRTHADAALTAFLAAVWAEAIDFVFDAERFEAAYAELEKVGYEGFTLARVVAPVEGLVLESPAVALGDGLTLARMAELDDAPAELRGDGYATVVVLRLELDGEARALDEAGRRLRRLQTALRLWDDAEPSVGPVAWAQSDGGPWLLVPLDGGLRRARHDCLLAADEEDPLRAFCSLVARRTPRGGELAWALRRFELGCERPSALDALTDWLLAARALLGEQADPGDARLCERLAAICAAPDERPAAALRTAEAVALERRSINGAVRHDPAVEALVAELGSNLRAVLRDVLCGHLDPDLRRLADGLLVAPAHS